MHKMILQIVSHMSQYMGGEINERKFQVLEFEVEVDKEPIP